MRPFISAFVIGVVLALAPTAAGGPNEDNASCMGLGASFYGQFAPQQMAFVAAAVSDAAAAAGVPPGATFSFFAGEKEGGVLPPPCGTRLE